jgi:type III secretory pathway component EscT
MAPWLITRLTHAGPAAVLCAFVLLWARCLPLFVLVPWLGLRSGPSLLLLVASFACACVLAPLAFAGVGPLSAGLPLMAALPCELARGSLLALGCALPLALLASTGVLSDALRAGPLVARDSALARLYPRAGVVVALLASAQLGVLRLFVSTLETAPLASALTDSSAWPALLRELGSLVVQSFELAVAFSAPVLLGMWLCALVLGLLSRVAARLLTPLTASALLPWLGLALVCLFSVKLLDEAPSLFQLFTQKTTRLLGALH